MSDRGGLPAVGDAATRRRLTLLGTALVVVVGTAIAARTVNLGEALGAVRAADPWPLAAAVGVYACSWPVRGRRYDDVLGAIERRCGTGFCTAAVFLSQTANLAIPARAGDGVRAYLLHERRGVPYATGAASLAVERAFDLVAIAVLGAVALGWLVLTGDGAGLRSAPTALPAAAGVAAVAVALSAATVAVARSDRRFAPAIRARIDRPLATRAADALLSACGDVRAVATRPRAMATVGAGSLLVWLLDVATAVLVLSALERGLAAGAPVRLLAVGTLAVSVGNLAKVLPLSQGGIGLYEAAFTALVAALAPIGAGTALAAAVLDHAVKNAVTLAGGGAAAIALNVRPSTAARDAGAGAAGEDGDGPGAGVAGANADGSGTADSTAPRRSGSAAVDDVPAGGRPDGSAADDAASATGDAAPTGDD